MTTLQGPSRTTPRPFGRVLVTVDFTPASGLALTRAMHLPLEAGAKLELLHVLPPAPPAPTRGSDEAGVRRRMRRAAELRRPAVPGLGRVTVTTAVVRSDSAAAISRHARLTGTELIVVGRGSGTAVARLGRLPVLVVGGPRAGRYRRPLVALGLDHGSAGAMLLAGRVAGRWRAIRVIHACDAPVEALSRRVGLGLTPAGHGLAHLIRARREVAGYLGSLGLASSPLRVAVRCGPAAEVVLAQARARRADLIVLGVHGREAPMPRLLLGSVAEDVLREARCDVLIARPA